MLTCEQAQKMVMPYIKDELTDKELETFLTHIGRCAECRDELEITFTIYMGLLQLNDKADEEDITAALEDSLNRSWLRVRAKKLRDVICYCVDTLCVTGVVTALIMQAAMWIH